MNIIALNGPPRSGKDTVGGEFVKTLRDAREFKFASPLKRATHASFNLMVPENFFEDVKDQQREEFFGRTPRQAYINHSEFYMKPLYGKDIYGKLMARQLRHYSGKKGGPKYAVITDCGFIEELLALQDAHNIILIRVLREGHDFKNDSRSYIHWHRMVEFNNTDGLDMLRYKVQQLCRELRLV